MLSVVIPTCNRNDLLDKCLSRLSAQSQNINTICYEVIVTDDNKNDAAKEFIEMNHNWVQWVSGPKRGPAANRNNGAKYANGEWLLFIDDDCIPDGTIISEYLKAISANPKIEALEGKIYVDEEQTSFLQEAPVNLTGGYFWSCNICIKKDLFIKLNGFDEGFPHAAMEDVDFFLRLKQVTSLYMFLPNAAVMHPWRTNYNLYEDIKKRFLSQQYYRKKHPEESKNVSTVYYLRAFVKFLISTFKRSFDFRFRGFATKVKCDFLQLRFAFKTFFS